MTELPIAAGLLIGGFTTSVAPTGKLGYEERYLPEDQTRSVSIIAGVIVIPLFAVVDVRLYGSLDAIEYGLDAERLIVVGRKAAA